MGYKNMKNATDTPMIPSFTDFYDISIILPFFKKLAIFKKTLKRNYKYFRRNGIEVIICLDDPSEKEKLLMHIKKYPFINWVVLLNRKSHAWRNPSKAINVGIRHAKFEYILVMGPDSEFMTDLIHLLRFHSFFHENSFFIGQVAFVDTSYKVTNDSKKHLDFLPYGSILASKKLFYKVGGYNEKMTEWGGDDDEIRARMELSGAQKMLVPGALLLHREENDFGHQLRTKKSGKIAPHLKERIFLPNKVYINDNKWGRDFNQLIYTYNNNQFAYSQLLKFLGQFKSFELTKNNFNKRRGIIALVQTYNESKNIRTLLTHLEDKCDGVILLDDNSTDTTYDDACNYNLLLKVKKHRDHFFDDLKNRNILLSLASFFICDWLFFIDADERFDDRYCDLRKAISKIESPTICFYLVHLWDKDTTFRTDLPERSPINVNGILHRWRMFKKKGYLQINNSKTLHFHATPYKTRRYIAPILIKHYGFLNTKIRDYKARLYKKEDDLLVKYPDRYNYLHDNHYFLKDLSEIPALPRAVLESIKYLT